MPSSSKKQHNFMAAVAHSPSFAKKVGVPQSVGKDFTAADKGKKFMNPRARKKGGTLHFLEGGDTAWAKKREKERLVRVERHTDDEPDEKTKREIQRRLKEEAKQKKFDEEYESYKRWKANEGQDEKDTIKDVGRAVLSGTKSVAGKVVSGAEKATAAVASGAKNIVGKIVNKVKGKSQADKDAEETTKPDSWEDEPYKPMKAMKKGGWVKSKAKKPKAKGSTYCGGGMTKAYAKGGLVSSRADGIASRGRTKCKIV